jgi:PAS domain S-box-containing protein
MPPQPPADQPATPAPEPGAVDALISQTRQLRGKVDAVRRGSGTDGEDPRRRWQRALFDLAVHQLDDLGEHLGQLRDGLGEAPRAERGGSQAREQVPGQEEQVPGQEEPQPLGRLLRGTGRGACPAPAAAAPAKRLGRAGSAEWNLLADEVEWSDELFSIFGRTAHDGPLTLDELPSWVFVEDRPGLTSMVTDCLVDGRPIDGEFRIVRADGSVRTLHMVGEPVLDGAGVTTSMWAVLRDVSELRRSQRMLRETCDSLRREEQIAQTERRLAVELQEAVLPPWRGSLRFPRQDRPQDSEAAAVDVASHYLPAANTALIGGGWYDALPLPGGDTLFTVGDLTGNGVSATSGMAMLLGALRGMALAGLELGPLMGWLNQLLDASAQPALGSALCCRYEPEAGRLVWAQAGHPAPLLFRHGTGRLLDPPEGILLGATSGARYTEAVEPVEPGDLLVLHTDGLLPQRGAFAPATRIGVTARRLLALGPRFAQARTAQECVRTIVEECDAPGREDDACVLVARFS